MTRVKKVYQVIFRVKIDFSIDTGIEQNQHKGNADV